MAQEIVGDDAWLAARESLLAKEKELTRLRDEVTAARQAMPWRRVTTDYRFEGPGGNAGLADLFGSVSQLVVVHFMFGPGWEEGCKICSFWADQYDAIRPHLAARDVNLVVVSRGELERLDAFRRRMGWNFPWYSSAGSSFNEDFGVSFPGKEEGTYNYRETRVMEEQPGVSVFARGEGGEVFHTYSLYSRGLDPLNAAYQFLDLAPRGRDEANLPFSMAWVNHHDAY